MRRSEAQHGHVRTDASLPMGWRYVVILVIVVGVPIGLAAYLMVPDADFKGVYLSLGVLFVLAAIRDPSAFVGRPTQIAFNALFVSLFVGSIPTIARAGWAAFYGQLNTLIICYLWASAFFLAFTFVRTRAEVEFALGWLRRFGLVISASVHFSYSLAAWTGLQFGEVVDAYGQFRAFGPLGDNVGFVIALFALWSFARQAWLQFAFHAAAIIMTGTRGALLSLAVGMLYLTLPLTTRHRLSHRLRLVTRGVLAVGLLTLLMMTTFAETTYLRMFDYGERAVVARDRMDATQLGLRVFGENPLLGVGFGGFRDEVRRYSLSEYFSPGMDVERGTFSTTNQYLQTATDGGILGLGCFIGFAVLLIRSTKRAAAVEEGGLGSDLTGIHAYVVAMLVGNQTTVWLYPHASSGYFLLLSAGIAERALSLRAVHSTPVRNLVRRNSVAGGTGQ